MTKQAVSPHAGNGPDPRLDFTALGLSTLCVLHCLAVPLLVLSQPVFAVVAEAEWLHKIFVLLAFPISGLSFLQIRRHHIDRVFVTFAAVGLMLLFASAFLERFHPQEQLFTILGAVSLSVAHLWRLFRHKP
ncbi:MAG: MerC domain-containing protein [Pseudomonadota bacterium]